MIKKNQPKTFSFTKKKNDFFLFNLFFIGHRPVLKSFHNFSFLIKSAQIEWMLNEDIFNLLHLCSFRLIFWSCAFKLLILKSLALLKNENFRFFIYHKPYFFFNKTLFIGARGASSSNLLMINVKCL